MLYVIVIGFAAFFALLFWLFSFNFLIDFWTTPGIAQGLILAVHSEVTPSKLGGHMGCWGSDPGLLHARQVSYLMYYLFGPSCLVPCYIYIGSNSGKPH